MALHITHADAQKLGLPRAPAEPPRPRRFAPLERAAAAGWYVYEAEPVAGGLIHRWRHVDGRCSAWAATYEAALKEVAS